MTGYGNAKAEVSGVQININIKTVNSRYLDVRPHIPKLYAPIEDKMIKVLKKELQRGTCDIYVQRQVVNSSNKVSFRFQTELAEKWLKAYRQSLRELGIEESIRSQDLWQIPDYMTWQEESSLSASESKAVLAALLKAVKTCQQEREREGRFLKKTCTTHITALQKRVQALKGLRKTFIKEAKAKFEARLEKLGDTEKMEPARVMQEVAVLVDRTDVEEELSRLSEHIKNVKTLLGSKQPAGKKLDFYAQELLREINTIGSKSQSAKITENIVEAKSLIEQFREQVQNIE